MYYLTEDKAYNLWEQTERSWEDLYNVLYDVYYNGRPLNMDRDTVYKMMQIAKSFDNQERNFPETNTEFYEVVNQYLNK